MKEFLVLLCMLLIFDEVVQQIWSQRWYWESLIVSGDDRVAEWSWVLGVMTSAAADSLIILMTLHCGLQLWHYYRLRGLSWGSVDTDKCGGFVWIWRSIWARVVESLGNDKDCWHGGRWRTRPRSCSR